MSVLDQAQRLARSGRRSDAVALVERAADKGDGEALFALANWRLYGLFVRRDADAALDLLGRAAETGHAEAGRLLAGLVDGPDGARAILAKFPRDAVARRQLALLDAAPGALPPRDPLCEDPPVALVRGLFSPDECDYLVERAEPVLRPSVIVDPATGRPKPDPVRTSDGMNFGPGQQDAVVAALAARMAAAAGTSTDCGEPLHILRYRPGQEYKPHSDALPGTENQRSWTAIVYLNDGYAGGETVFPELALSAKGEPGDCLVFRNVRADGSGDPRARHAGTPVTDGVKWLASRWIRERPFDPFAGE